MEITIETLARFTLFAPLIGLILMLSSAILLHQYPYWQERVLGWITVLLSCLLLIASVWMIFLPEKNAQFSWLGIDFRLDALSAFMIFLVNVVAFAASWNALDYLPRKPIARKKGWQQGWTFHVLIHLFHFTMLLAPLTDNLVIAWIAIELTTLGSAILIVYEDKPAAWEATWKYLVVTSAGIVLALLGTIFLANSLPPEIIRQNPSNKLLNWSYLMATSQNLDKQFVWFAFLFSLAGYGTKAGLAPLHTWLPDGHGEAPSPVSALLSGVLLKASLYVILRFFVLTNLVLEKGYEHWTFLTFLVIGLISLVTSVPLILRPHTPFKRVLAYHSLEHMGIIMFGLGMGGFVATAGAILHMLNHAITKALMFLAYGNLLKRYEKVGIPIRGALRTMPFSGALLTLGGLALVGMPLFNVFMSEWLILWGSLARFFRAAGEYPSHPSVLTVSAIILFVLSTTLIFYGLVGHLRKMVLDKPTKEMEREKFGLTSVMPVVFLALLMLLLGICIMPPLAQLVDECAQIVLNITRR